MVCFKCRKNRVQIKRSEKAGGLVIRTRICRHCLHRYKTVETPILSLMEKEEIKEYERTILESLGDNSQYTPII